MAETGVTRLPEAPVPGLDFYVLYNDPTPDAAPQVVFGPQVERACKDFWNNMLNSNLHYAVVHKSKYTPKRVVAPPAKPFPSEDQWITDPDKKAGGKRKKTQLVKEGE